jgi:hypothetical protein
LEIAVNNRDSKIVISSFKPSRSTEQEHLHTSGTIGCTVSPSPTIAPSVPLLSRFIQAETMENILKDCADKLISAANTIGSVIGSAEMAETRSAAAYSTKVWLCGSFDTTL